MQTIRAFQFPEAVAYGRRGNSAAVERCVLEALANGDIVYTISPTKDGDRHICKIYPFRQKNVTTPLLQWPSLG